MKKLIICILFLALFLVVKQNSFAIPALQLYIEGSTYDTSTESWVTSSPNFILWVLGDVDSYGTISVVKLATAFPTGESGNISLIPTTASAGQLPYPDLYTPISPSPYLNGTNTIPLDGKNTPLPSHGIYGNGTSWQSYQLGNFTSTTDAPIGDYINGTPSSYPSWGQINAYNVTVSGGYSWVHFDAFDHYYNGQNNAKYVFAPFSHDAEVVPEPASLLLLGSGFAGLLVLGSLRKRRS